MPNVSDKSRGENKKPYFFPTIVALNEYKMLRENAAVRDRPQMTIIRYMRIARWKTKATDTDTQYLMFIAFPRQQQSRERAPMLHKKYTACLVNPDMDSSRLSLLLTYYFLYSPRHNSGICHIVGHRFT